MFSYCLADYVLRQFSEKSAEEIYSLQNRVPGKVQVSHHAFTQIPDKNFLSSMKVFRLASQIPKIKFVNSASPQIQSWGS